jgi:hypothetical protein
VAPYPRHWSADLQQQQRSMHSSFAGSTFSTAGGPSSSIVRAIAALGLEGAGSGGGSSFSAAPDSSSGAAVRRGSISRAKRILAEAISCVPGAHGLASCGSAAADTGVLSPLLTIIRNNGVVRGLPAVDEATAASSLQGSSRRSVSRRSSFSDAMLSGSSSSSSRGVTRRASFSEATGGLNCPSFVEQSCGLGIGGPAAAPICELQPLSLAAADSSAAEAAVSRVVDSLDTIRFLAMDESNRMALIDLGAVELLLSKLQPSKGRLRSVSSNSGSRPSLEVATPPSAVFEAALSALAALARHDATKLRVWDNGHSAALLALLSAGRHTAPLTKAAHLCVAQLAWSFELDQDRGACYTPHNTSSVSSIFDSVSSHPGGRGDDAASTSSSGCGSNVLLTPALIPALAAGLHPAADVPVLLSLLKLLTKAVGSSCLASSAASTPTSTSSSGSRGELCAVQQVAVECRAGWQAAIFALPPLLCLHEAGSSSSGGGTANRQAVVDAALELLVALCEQHPELHAVVCTAGCLSSLLVLLMGKDSHASLQAGCALAALLDCPAALAELCQEQALTALLHVVDDVSKAANVRVASLHMLRRLAGAVPACAGLLSQLGAVHATQALLQQVHGSDVRRGAVALLQLLGKQVVVRPRSVKQHRSSVDGGSSGRSSFESCISDGSGYAGCAALTTAPLAGGAGSAAAQLDGSHLEFMGAWQRSQQELGGHKGGSGSHDCHLHHQQHGSSLHAC